MYSTYDQIETKLNEIEVEYDLTKITGSPRFKQLSSADQDFIKYIIQGTIENEIKEIKRASHDCHEFIEDHPKFADFCTEGQSRIIGERLNKIENLYFFAQQFIEGGI